MAENHVNLFLVDQFSEFMAFPETSDRPVEQKNSCYVSKNNKEVRGAVRNEVDCHAIF